jgi:hypothetical protein
MCGNALTLGCSECGEKYETARGFAIHLGLAPKYAEAHAKAVPVDEGVKRAAALVSRAGEAADAANVKVCTTYTSKSTRLSCKYTHSSFPALNACVFVCVLVQDHLVNAYADIRYNKMFSSTAVQSYFCSGRIPLQNCWERR